MSFFELIIGLLFVYLPGLTQEYLYPHCAHVSSELALIQMGWIYVGMGFWSISLLYNSISSEADCFPFTSLSLIWSLPLFKEIWSICYLVSWQFGWGGFFHSLQIALIIGICIYSYVYKPSKP